MTPPTGTAAVLRDLEERDVPHVLALNEAEVAWLAPLDEPRLREIHAWADLFLVAELDGEFAGFVVTMAPGTTYDSRNYRWFAERYADGFYYLDRVVLTAATRRRGVGTAIYDVAEARAERFGRLALEVHVDPPNEPSLAFHRDRGFAPVGELGVPGDRDVLLVKELPRG